ncbi:MAG: nitrilase-related carbon-nitrogen hydrolase [Acidobacteriota bacterium]
MIQPYEIMGIQSNIRQVFRDKKGPPRLEAIEENLEHALSLLEGRLSPEWSVSPKLVVFPEFFLQGYTPGRSIQDWIDIGIRIPGKESRILGKKAKELNCYIAANVWEFDEEWPGRYWDTTFIVDPSGEVILRYKKHCARLGYAFPNDVLDEFVRRHGDEALFPVVDTPIGKLGCFICYDCHFPEVARCLAMNGAEILIHCDGNPRGNLAYTQAKDRAIRSRAWENKVYIITVKRGHWLDGDLPYDEGEGQTAIIDYQGQDLSVARTSGECTIKAEIDVERLRYARSQTRHNFLPMVQSEVYARYYKRASLYPANVWQDKPAQSLKELQEVTQKQWDKMYERGIFVKPEGC